MECDRSQVLFLPLSFAFLARFQCVWMMTGVFGEEFGQARRPTSTRLSSTRMNIHWASGRTRQPVSVLAKRSHQLLLPRICTHTINQPGGQSLVSLSIGPFVSRYPGSPVCFLPTISAPCPSSGANRRPGPGCWMMGRRWYVDTGYRETQIGVPFSG